MILTRSITICWKLYGYVPSVQKKVQRGHKRSKIQQEVFRGQMCAVNGNPLEYLEYSNSLQKKLHFTIETPNGNGNLFEVSKVQTRSSIRTSDAQF